MPSCDLLIIGSGVAGCAAALAAADAGLDVVLATNAASPEKGSNTSWAQGGIIFEGLSDSPEKLAADIHAAGHGVCEPGAVRHLAEQGPRLVEELLIRRLETPFDRRDDGSLDLTEEGAHSEPRIIHVGDHTGEAIARALGRAVEAHPRVRLLANATAVDLVMTAHHTLDPVDIYQPPRCLGCYILDQATGVVEPWTARETVLATGGLGQIFLHTTNPKRSRGDGLAMAYRAGARVINLEYIQFHPTAFYHPLAPRFLVSESLRGEGAHLVDASGRRFMPAHHPDGELASRDLVARAIHEEMLASGAPCMYLDISHKDAGWVRRRFPLIHEYLLKWDIDLAEEPVPIVPAAHYACGGVAVDRAGRTNIGGLRAVGEVSCTGVHGANRLASTSLLEGLLWGYGAGEDIARRAEDAPVPDLAAILPWSLESEEIDPALIKQDWMTIKQTMWNYVGLVRTGRRMNRALRILRELQFEIESFYRRAAMTDELVGLRNGAQTALAVTHSAIRNRASRGGHYRTDSTDPRAFASNERATLS